MSPLGSCILSPLPPPRIPFSSVPLIRCRLMNLLDVRAGHFTDVSGTQGSYRRSVASFGCSDLGAASHTTHKPPTVGLY